TPFLSWKNWLYRTFLRMKVGDKTAFALMVMPDTMFPELIVVGDNSIIGYNTTILAHEYLTDEYRLCIVEIGSNVMIGGNTTILPGVTIGDGAIVSAATLVHQDRKSTRLNSSHVSISYAVFCLKKKNKTTKQLDSNT